jgi:CRISPR-associated endonuclease/helicase Cas3
MVLAKSEPRLTLGEHTEDVVAEAECILARLRYDRKYKRITGHSLGDRLLTAARYHDLGKAHPRWQKHLKNGDLINVGLRHELASLVHMDAENVKADPVVRAAIAAHHNKLGQYHRSRWTDTEFEWNHLDQSAPSSFEHLWSEFTGKEKEAYLSADDADLIRTRYEYDVVRGLLQLADRRASQIEDPDSSDPLSLRPFRYQFPHNSYLPVQKAAVDQADRDVLALRSETGSGKTAAALLWAREQVRNRRARRAIMAMPTRFTSSSLAGDVSGDVSAGLYHSSAWQKLQDDPRSHDKLAMARQFLYPLTVTTIDQVMTCLTGRREDHHLRFANLAHSCLIIDECDFYDDVVQANIEELMRVLQVLDVPVLVMSATLPSEHLGVYFPDRPSDDLVDTTRSGNEFEISGIESLEQPDRFLDSLPPPIRDADRLIVYANTVARAVGYFDALQEYRDDVILYHSRFTEPDKAKKEAQIRQMLGEEGRGGVAVMTQIGEMSLNISAASMVSELCPVDRLAQRTGRMGRFSGDDGRLFIIEPMRDETLYPAPYGDIQPGEGWIPAPALLETRSLLDTGQTLTKQDLTDLTNAVYDEPIEYGTRARQNADQLQKDLRSQWLIVPEFTMEADDTEGPVWSSRMIGPQIDVFVRRPPTEAAYDTRRAFDEAKLEHVISLPRYRLQTEGDRFERTTIAVEDDEESAFVLTDPNEYSFERGLI